MKTIKEISKKIIEYIVILLGIIMIIIPQFIGHYVFELEDWVKEQL